MKTQLNYKDCSFILNRSEEYSMGLLMKENSIKIQSVTLQVAAKGKNKTKEVKGHIVFKNGQQETLDPKEFKEEDISWKISVERLTEVTGINVAALIKDINTNFFRNEVCVEYLLKK